MSELGYIEILYGRTVSELGHKEILYVRTVSELGHREILGTVSKLRAIRTKRV